MSNRLTGHPEQLQGLIAEGERALQVLVNRSHEQRESQIFTTRADREKVIFTSHSERLQLIDASERSRADRVASTVSGARLKIEEVRAYVGNDTQIMQPIDSWFAEKRRQVNSREQEKRQTISTIETTKQQQIVGFEQTTRQTIQSKQAVARQTLAPADVRQYSINWITEKIDVYQRMLAETHRTSYDSLLSRITVANSELKMRLDTASRELDERLRVLNTELDEKLRRARTRYNEQEAARRQKAQNTTSGHQSQGNGSSAANKPKPPGQSQNKDQRLNRLAGKETGIDLYPHKVFLANLDNQRSKSKTDEEIYKLLVRHFHPDRSTHKNAAEITRILTVAYDKQEKKFTV